MSEHPSSRARVKKIIFRIYQSAVWLIFLSTIAGEIILVVKHFKSKGKISDLVDTFYTLPMGTLCLLKMTYFFFNSKRLSQLVEILESGPCKSQSEAETEIETMTKKIMKLDIFLSN